MRRVWNRYGWVAVYGALACSSSDKPDIERGSDFILGGDDVTGGGGSTGVDDQRPQCLGETREAEALGLDMFVMLDISASMLEVLPQVDTLSAPRTKWDAVRQALQAFIQAPDSSDIGIGIQYFPQAREGVPTSCQDNADCGDTGGPCSNNFCVENDRLLDPEGENPPLTFLRTTDGDVTYCASNDDCVNGGTCRTIIGQCVAPPGLLAAAPEGTFLNVSDDPDTLVEPLCTNQNDCGGLPGTGCEVLGVCSIQTVLCSPTIACPPGAGVCQPFPFGCVNQTECAPEAYATPAVPISNAPNRSIALLQSLQSQVPNGLTPTGPALRGALDHARDWALQNPGRQVVTVLATDGFPTECNPVEILQVADIAATAANSDRPVRTFVIGVFSDADLGTNGQLRLNEIARRGGTDRAFVINTGGNVVTAFANALNAIRDRSVSCEFQLESSGALDYDRVNLQVRNAAGSITDLVSVGDVSACGADGQGWYYVRDAVGTPTQINVCPSTCETFGGEGVRVDLQIGCETRIQ